MQLRVSQNESRETLASARAERAAMIVGKPERQDLAGLLLSFQRARGNRFVQQVLSGSLSARECKCSGTCNQRRPHAFDQHSSGVENLLQREGDLELAGTSTRHFLPLPPARRREENMGEVKCNPAKGELEQIVNRDHCGGGDCVAQHEQEHKSDPNIVKACRGVNKCMTNENANWGWVPPEYQALGQTESWIYSGFCRDSYEGWHRAYSDWTECQAYRRELGCLNGLIHRSCGGRRSDLQAGFGIGLGILGAIGGAIGGYFLAGALNVTADWGIGLMAGAGGVLGGGLMSLAGVGLGSLIAGPVDEGCCNNLRGENGLQAVNDSIAKHCPGASQAHAAPIPFGEDGSITDRRYLPGELSKT